MEWLLVGGAIYYQMIVAAVFVAATEEERFGKPMTMTQSGRMTAAPPDTEVTTFRY
jgi:hypothetical protein